MPGEEVRVMSSSKAFFKTYESRSIWDVVLVKRCYVGVLPGGCYTCSAPASDMGRHCTMLAT